MTAGGRRLAWRGRVVVVALACLLGQTSALMHRVLVQHATCAEHGESVHVAAASGPSSRAGAASQGDQGDQGDSQRSVLSAALVEDADQHEHCAAADSRSSTPRLVPDRTFEPVPVRTFTLLATDAGLRSDVASYLIAPKTSPPHAAS